MIRNTLLSLFSIAAMTIAGCKEQSAAPEVRKAAPEPVLVITNIVKPGAKTLYDKFMKEVLLNTLTNYTTKAGDSHPRFLAPETQNDDSTWTYMIIIPAHTAGNYSIASLLENRYGLQKATEYQSIYTSCLKCPPVINRLVTAL